MKLIIAGSRHISVSDVELTEMLQIYSLNPTEIVSGTARGIDRCGEFWAKLNNVQITAFYPDWNTHGNAAGPIRNAAMADYADELLIIWDGRSKGSANMKQQMIDRNKPVHEFVLKDLLPKLVTRKWVT